MRVALLVGVAAVVVAVAFLTKDDSVARTVEIEAVAEAGGATIQLSSDALRPMSPGCGCMDPSFGAHEWFGMSFPSTGFETRCIWTKSRFRGRRCGGGSRASRGATG